MIRSLFNTVDLCCEGFVDFHDLQDSSLGMSLKYHCSCFVMGVMHEADNAYSIRSTWLCYRLVRFLIWYPTMLNIDFEFVAYSFTIDFFHT